MSLKSVSLVGRDANSGTRTFQGRCSGSASKIRTTKVSSITGESEWFGLIEEALSVSTDTNLQLNGGTCDRMMRQFARAMFARPQKTKKVTRAIFLHPQKTAGSSFVELAKKHYGTENVSSHGDFALGDDSNKDFISGHFGHAYAEKYLDYRFSFTFLRDPIDRVISLYNFCQSRDPNQFPIYAAANGRSFEDFVRYCSKIPDDDAEISEVITYESVWNNLTWQLAWGWQGDLNTKNRVKVSDFKPDELLRFAKINLKKLSYVGLRESFDLDAREIGRCIGMENPEIPKINESKKVARREDLSEQVLTLLKEVNSLDIELYDYAISLRGRSEKP